jgi:nicotinamidase-related amidase
MNTVHAADSDRLDLEQAQLLVVDLQEKLLPHIHEHERVLTQAGRMIRAARVLDLPITVSEQYPKGLGGTAPAILAAAEDAVRLEKTTFSFCADDACRARLSAVGRPQVLLVGIETHVCVQQTALDLLEMQMRPYVLADAIGSRRPLDYEVALDYMRSFGVTVTTVEAAIFRLVRAAGTELFKRILPIVR